MSMQPGATAGGPRQRLIVVTLAAVLVLVLALAVRPLLLAGGNEARVAPTGTTTAAAASTTTSTVVLGPSERPRQSTKDPFHPLVAPAAAAGSAAGATPTTGPTVASTVPGAGAGTATTPGGGATAAEHKVALADIVSQSGGRVAKVTVDGTAYTVSEGETFAGDYRAVDIGSSCATFESGTTPFTLCEGEAVLK
jgi:hypothetical protein